MTAVSATTSPQAMPRRRVLSPLTWREIRWGVFFLSPWLVGFLVFTILPMIASLIFSVTNYNPLHPDQTRFVGLANYAQLLTDPLISQAWVVTLRFALISIPISIMFPLAIAVLVNSEHLFAKNIFRTLFYMPSMIPVVVNVMVWGGVLNSDSGWVNRVIEYLFNTPGPRWFQDERLVLVSLTILGFWGVGGTMLTMLAGLQNVPTELYDAGKVDGANGAQRFFMITLPMISPIIFYNLLLSIIGSFQYFVQAYIISNGRGDPNNSTLFYNLYLYKTGFVFLDMGYGSTMAWTMFAVVLVLTIVMFKLQNRWVYYAGGD